MDTKQAIDIIDYCREQPEIRSWLDFFDDPAEDTVGGEAEDVAVDDGAVPGAEDDSDILR